MCTHHSTHNTKHTYMIFITVTRLLSSKKNETSRSSVVNTHNVTNPIQSPQDINENSTFKPHDIHG